MNESGRGKNGVHRGKIESGHVLSSIIKILENIFKGEEIPDMKIVGSNQKKRRGSRWTDLDIVARVPRNTGRKRLNEIEREIQEKTGADFYFDDEDYFRY